MALLRRFILTYIWISDEETNKLKSKKIIKDITLRSNNGSNKELINLIPELIYNPCFYEKKSDSNCNIILKPKFICDNPFACCCDRNSVIVIHNVREYLVLCDVYNADHTPHQTNRRFECVEITKLSHDQDPLFSVEQECSVREGCGFSYTNNNKILTTIMDEHMSHCLYLGLHVTETEIYKKGVNLLIKYKMGELDAVTLADELWISRYIFDVICQKYNYVANYVAEHPVNFNFQHNTINFSTNKMRSEGGIHYIHRACEKLHQNLMEHILNYNIFKSNFVTDHVSNYMTDPNESKELSEPNTDNIRPSTPDISRYFGIPTHVFNEGKGCLEDRRISSNSDPYAVTTRILKTICLDL